MDCELPSIALLSVMGVSMPSLALGTLKAEEERKASNDCSLVNTGPERGCTDWDRV